MSWSDIPWERKGTRSHPIKINPCTFQCYYYIFFCYRKQMSRERLASLPMWLAFVSAWPLHQLCQVINGSCSYFREIKKNLYYNSKKLAKKVKQLKSGPIVHYIIFNSHKPCGPDIIEKWLRKKLLRTRMYCIQTAWIIELQPRQENKKSFYWLWCSVYIRTFICFAGL